MPTSTLTAEVVTRYVADTVGREVIGVRTLPGSVANQDFLVRLEDASAVVVKAGPRAEMAAEAWACRRLTTIGVPVPPVVAVDLDTGLGGLPTLIVDFVPGGPSESPDVAYQAGRRFRRVHAEVLPGWGPLIVDGHEEGSPVRGAHASWAEAVHAELSGLPELVDAGVIDGRLAAAARACVLIDELLGYAGPGVLLHQDLKPAHLFGVEDGDGQRLTAVIDWGGAGVGDPVADLARLSMAGATVTEAFLAGYERRLTDDLADRLTRYRILWHVGTLSYEHRAGGDWFDVYRQRLRADVGQLTS